MKFYFYTNITFLAVYENKMILELINYAHCITLNFIYIRPEQLFQNYLYIYLPKYSKCPWTILEIKFFQILTRKASKSIKDFWLIRF